MQKLERLVALSFSFEPLLDVHQHARKTRRLTVLVHFDPPARLDPSTGAVSREHAVLVTVGAAAGERLHDAGQDTVAVVGVDPQDGFLARETGATALGIEAEELREQCVRRETVFPNLPDPRADDRPGVQRQLHPLSGLS